MYPKPGSAFASSIANAIEKIHKVYLVWKYRVIESWCLMLNIHLPKLKTKVEPCNPCKTPFRRSVLVFYTCFKPMPAVVMHVWRSFRKSTLSLRMHESTARVPRQLRIQLHFDMQPSPDHKFMWCN